MDTAYVVEAEMVDRQTIHLNEPVDFKSGKVIVTIQSVKNENSPLQKTKFFELAGKIEIDEKAVNALRLESML